MIDAGTAEIVADDVRPLSQVADLVMGQSPPGTACSRAPNGTPLLNGPTEFGERHPVPAQWTTAPTKFAQAGDILFCVRGSTTGRMNIADQPYCIGRGIAAIRGKDATDTKFIKYTIEAGLEDLLTHTTGTVFPNISGSDLRRFSIPWPPDSERKRITAVIDAIDELVTTYQSLERTLGRLVVSECHAAFEERSTEDEFSLLEAVQLVNGGAYTNGADGAGRMVIRIKELNSGPSETTVYSSIDVPVNKTAAPGDVLFAWSGSLGLWRWYRDDAIINQHIFKVIAKAHPVWLGLTHVLDDLERFRDIAAGKATTMGHITKDHLERTMVPKMTDAELAELARRVEPIWDYQLRVGRGVYDLIEFRSFLLPRLLSGELRVEAAEQLVEATA